MRKHPICKPFVYTTAQTPTSEVERYFKRPPIKKCLAPSSGKFWAIIPSTIGMPSRNEKGRSVFDVFAKELFKKLKFSGSCELRFPKNGECENLTEIASRVFDWFGWRQTDRQTDGQTDERTSSSLKLLRGAGLTIVI